MKSLYKVLTVGLLAISSLAYANENVVLKLDMFINNDLVKPVVVKGSMAETFTVQIDNEVKYDIVPTMEDGAVKLSTIYYTYADGAFIQKEKPVLVTAVNKTATIEIGAEGVKVYKIQITPQTKI
ncbi:MAG: hypothetical protein GY787_16060 [Alteromonadales bacterium]|nr:hypothetical protein [Alteromonadales bacterium]